MVSRQHRQLRLHCVFQTATVAHTGQRVDADLREHHQVRALLANLVVGAGDLRGQLKGWSEDVLGLAAEVLPGDLLFMFAQTIDLLFETRHARMVPRKALPNRRGDFVQFGRNGLRAFQFAPGPNPRVSLVPMPLPTKQISNRGNRSQGHGGRYLQIPPIHSSPPHQVSCLDPRRPGALVILARSKTSQTEKSDDNHGRHDDSPLVGTHVVDVAHDLIPEMRHDCRLANLMETRVELSLP